MMRIPSNRFAAAASIVVLTLLAAAQAKPAVSGPGIPGKNRPVFVERRAGAAEGRIVVKRSPSGLAKSSKTWEQTLAAVAPVRVEPAFPTHANDHIRLSDIFEVRLPAGANVYDACDILMQDGAVEWAEPVYPRHVSYTPNDPAITNQWYLTKIKSREAWDVAKQSSGVLIGIVDTGIMTTHPDLKNAVWVNKGEIPGNGVDDDKNGYIDDVNGWDFGNNDGTPTPKTNGPSDARWHGTEVASLAGAVTDNGMGIASTAFNAKLMAVKIFNDDETGSSLIPESYKGIVYAADNGAHIINCSYGAANYEQVEAEAVAHACSLGCLIVAAAGNGGTDNSGPGEEVLSYPAAYPGVLAVAASTESDFNAYFTNFGFFVDLSAPGTNIYYATGESSYGRWEGTSFSSPITASAAALVKGLHPAWTGRQAGEQLRISCDPFDALDPEFAAKLGRGRINAYKAVTLKSPSIRLESAVLAEGPGANGDGFFDPGETVLLEFMAQNFLEPATGVTMVFSSSDPAVTIANPSFSIASLGTLQKWNNTGNPVRITLSKSVTRGQSFAIKASIKDNAGYQDADYASFRAAFPFATLHGGQCALTLTDMGRLGLADISTEIGDGFIYKGDDLLFEGAVMAGTAQDTLSDVARGDDGSTQNMDFAALPGGELQVMKPGILSTEQAEAVFSDGNKVPPLHLGVRFSAYAFGDAANADYVLLAYRLYSTSASSIRNLYFGLFMDWDVSIDQDSWHNLAGFDPALSLGYVYEKASSVYGGLAVVSQGGAGAYKCINNPDEIYDGYSKQEKWVHMSGGVRNVTVTEESDYSQLVGVGPLTIRPGDTTVVGFAVLGGHGLDDLKSHVQAARVKWQEIVKTTGVEDNPSSAVFRLRGAYPNPFNSGIAIEYDLGKRVSVVVSICDVRGREVARLVDAVEDAGAHRVRWGGNAPSGVYFLKIRAGEWSRTAKLSLLR